MLEESSRPVRPLSGNEADAATTATSERKWEWRADILAKHWWALAAVVLGNVLDAFDVMVYAFALTTILHEWNLTTLQAGFLATVSLLACSIGGVLSGPVADKIGRKRSIVVCIAVFTTFAGLSAFTQNLTQLAVTRAVLGLGWGGVWTVSVLLISESWPVKHRGKALSVTQAGWSLGYIAAAVASTVVLPAFGWRILFFLGVVPGLLIFWIIRHVDESPLYLKARAESRMKADYLQIFKGDMRRSTLMMCLISTLTMCGYWGLFTWLPGYLSLPIEKGGAGLSIAKSSGFLIPAMTAAWFGNAFFGVLADRFGRRPVFAVYVLVSCVMIYLLSSVRNETSLLILSPFVGFFAAGAFAGFGPMLSEVFPTSCRGFGVGFCYNFGRGISAFAPAVIGLLSEWYGIGGALSITAGFYLLAAGAVFLVPETAGKELE
ncbi:MFS transporter [Paraburkholderia azotifigens]|uniref:MFS transporter n=1 Tax=Paraburkholderia azotifigens TaxID=2057004 RepID=A0ABU9RGB3_9BURK